MTEEESKQAYDAYFEKFPPLAYFLKEDILESTPHELALWAKMAVFQVRTYKDLLPTLVFRKVGSDDAALRVFNIVLREYMNPFGGGSVPAIELKHSFDKLTQDREPPTSLDHVVLFANRTGDDAIANLFRLTFRAVFPLMGATEEWLGGSVAEAAQGLEVKGYAINGVGNAATPDEKTEMIPLCHDPDDTALLGIETALELACRALGANVTTIFDTLPRLAFWFDTLPKQLLPMILSCRFFREETLCLLGAVPDKVSPELLARVEALFTSLKGKHEQADAPRTREPMMAPTAEALLSVASPLPSVRQLRGQCTDEQLTTIRSEAERAVTEETGRSRERAHALIALVDEALKSPDESYFLYDVLDRSLEPSDDDLCARFSTEKLATVAVYALAFVNIQRTGVQMKYCYPWQALFGKALTAEQQDRLLELAGQCQAILEKKGKIANLAAHICSFGGHEAFSACNWKNKERVCSWVPLSTMRTVALTTGGQECETLALKSHPTDEEDEDDVSPLPSRKTAT